MVGTPATTLTRRSATSASAAAGSNRSTRTVAAPAASETPRTTLRPNTWKHGSTPRLTSAGVEREAGVVLDLLDVGGQAAVGELGGAGRPGGPGGEEQHRDVVGGPVDEGRLGGGERVEVDGERGVPGRGDEGHASAVGEDEARLDRGQLPFQLGGGAPEFRGTATPPARRTAR